MCAFLSIVLMTVYLIPAANAATPNELDKLDISEQELLDMIDFIENEAIQIDSYGNATVNLEIIKNKFGYIPQEYIDFNNANKNLYECAAVEPFNTVSTYAKAPKKMEPSKYDKCLTREIKAQWKDALGVSAFTAAVEALASGQKMKAAKYLIKAGAKGGIHGLVLTLGWIQIKCLGSI